jgi:hypothetical protein
MTLKNVFTAATVSICFLMPFSKSVLAVMSDDEEIDQNTNSNLKKRSIREIDGNSKGSNDEANKRIKLIRSNNTEQITEEFISNLTKLYEEVPLDLSTLEKDSKSGKPVQLMEELVQSKQKGNLIFEIKFSCKRMCNEVFKHIKYWKYDDDNLMAFKVYSVFIEQGKESIDSGKKITSKEAVDYILDSTEVKGGKDNSNITKYQEIPIMQLCNISQKYIRPDNSIYTLTKNKKLDLIPHHIRFNHQDNFSRQIVNFSVNFLEENYTTISDYENSKKHMHVYKHIKWDPDEVQHISTPVQKVYIDVTNALDKDNISEEDTIVHEAHEGQPVPHKKVPNSFKDFNLKRLIWDEYKIPHSGKQYYPK